MMPSATVSSHSGCMFVVQYSLLRVYRAARRNWVGGGVRGLARQRIRRSQLYNQFPPQAGLPMRRAAHRRAVRRRVNLEGTLRAMPVGDLPRR
jgi:hypothetical protein